MRVQHKSHPCGFLESAGDAVGEDRDDGCRSHRVTWAMITTKIEHFIPEQY